MVIGFFTSLQKSCFGRVFDLHHSYKNGESNGRYDCKIPISNSLALFFERTSMALLNSHQSLLCVLSIVQFLSESRQCGKYRDLARSNKIAELVAATGETVNIPDAESDDRLEVAFPLGLNYHEPFLIHNQCAVLQKHSHGYHTKSLLCKPIRNNSFQIIGKMC